MVRYVVVAAICGLVMMACSDDGDSPPADAGREVEEVLIVDGGETDDSGAEDEDVSDPLPNSFDEEGNPVLGTPFDCHERGISYGDRCLRMTHTECSQGRTQQCLDALTGMYLICDDTGAVIDVQMCDSSTMCLYDADGNVECGM